MKKLVAATLLLFLSLPSIASNDGSVFIMYQPNDRVMAKPICIYGYVFVVTAVGGPYDAGRGVSVVQVMQPGPTYGAGRQDNPQPIPCK